MLALCERAAQRGYRHFFYGGAPGVPEKLTDRLKARFPKLNVTGTYSPPFRPLTPQEDREIVHTINATKPDIVWVGISTPKQERWMAEHVKLLSAPVLIGVGAAFDFHAGLKKQAPAWMQKSGLEWSYRLMSEPRRLWLRYAVNNPFFLWLIFLQALTRKSVATYDQIVTRGERPTPTMQELPAIARETNGKRLGLWHKRGDDGKLRKV
jgi:N-acetylglucosaminyldiphosphoundecaprenol N-acetyl-beta-D-mannosaminyltransferase